MSGDEGESTHQPQDVVLTPEWGLTAAAHAGTTDLGRESDGAGGTHVEHDQRGADSG